MMNARITLAQQGLFVFFMQFDFEAMFCPSEQEFVKPNLQASSRHRSRSFPFSYLGVSGPAADGDCDDGGLDRRTPGDGQSGLPESLALSPEEIRPEVAIIKNRPLNT